MKYEIGDLVLDEDGNKGVVVIKWNDGDICFIENDASQSCYYRGMDSIGKNFKNLNPGTKERYKMAHHSSDFDPKMSGETIRQFINAGQKADDEIQKMLSEKLGPTGNFPQGKLTEHDEGEIAFAVYRKDGKVIIDFNSPVHWFGATPEQAVDLGRLLIKHGQKLLNK